jgi:hypothetical protein
MPACHKEKWADCHPGEQKTKKVKYELCHAQHQPPPNFFFFDLSDSSVEFVSKTGMPKNGSNQYPTMTMATPMSL